MLIEIRAHLRAAARYPQFRHLPCLVDECDPCVPAHVSRYDNPNFGFRNSAYYPAIMASVFKRIMDLNDSLPGAPDVALASSWAFYFEGERFFEAFREFFTAENVELPLLNGYRLLGRLGATRLPLTSDATWPIDQLDQLPGSSASSDAALAGIAAGAPIAAVGGVSDAEVDGLAALRQSPGDEPAVTIALWHHVDDQFAPTRDAQVEVTVRNLPFDPSRARLRHWRVDAQHSNAYAVWREMGCPQDPTPEQLATLRSRQGLEHGPDLAIETAGTSVVEVKLALPLHSLSLLEIDAG
jgi:xylan 1,4-beta-xylosidase